MSIVTVKDKTQTKLLDFEKPTQLSEFTKSFFVPMPCGGNHTCGKCKVYAKGNISPLSETERKYLSNQEIQNGIRLACVAQALGDCTIEILNNENNSGTVMLDGKKHEMNFYGLALSADIGTTTVAVYLYKDGKQIKSIGEHNKQSKFGADVITRIGVNKPQILQQTIVSQLTEMFEKVLCDVADVSEVERIVITGNTTMLHFLRGYDPASLAVSPFKTVSLFDEEIEADKIFPIFSNATLYLPPCISAYIGADVVCSIEVSEMIKKDETSILADIGTNGEMALYHKGTLVTCSTAAGPALEGACISQGMSAGIGAIDNVYLDKDTNSIGYHVIGDVKPTGICGSGLIRLTALLLELNLVDETGAIDEECEEYSSLIGEDDDGLFIYIGDSGITLTQRDIRQIQLAKASICAGIFTMLDYFKISETDVDVFYICGGFGSYIDPKSAGKMGLIPMSFVDKVVVLGNGAGAGASRMIDKEHCALGREIAKTAKIIELSESPFFMEQYIEQMSF